jgi:hypothetical protein
MNVSLTYSQLRVSRINVWFCLLIVPALAGCALPGLEENGFDFGLDGSKSAYVAAPPAAVYGRIARQVNNCWLHPDKPLLADHQFFAEAQPGAAARISLNQTDRNMRRGRRSYIISMQPSNAGTSISVDPVRIKDPVQQDMMQRAVIAWAHGELECNLETADEEPAVTATAEESEVSTDQTSAQAKVNMLAEANEYWTGLSPPLPVRRPYRKPVSAVKPRPSLAAAEQAVDSPKPRGPQMRGSSPNPQMRGSTPAIPPKTVEKSLPPKHIFGQSEPSFAGQ